MTQYVVGHFFPKIRWLHLSSKMFSVIFYNTHTEDIIEHIAYYSAVRLNVTLP